MRKPSPQARVVDVSLDFDFFVYEDVLWDFGHNETWTPSVQAMAWAARYQSIDLYRETDPARHADFLPHEFIDKLREKGATVLHLNDVGIADSHACAYHYFLSRFNIDGAPTLLLNIDAHHDLWPVTGKGASRVHCGNWLRALRHQRKQVPVTQAYPKWKDADADGPHNTNTNVTTWEKLDLSGYRVRNVFLCRSGSWVPPHHDAEFIALAQSLMARGLTYNVLDKMFERTAPTRLEAARQRRAHRKMIRDFRAQAQSSRELGEQVRQKRAEVEEGIAMGGS